ncbi:unnamed protein product [Adineta steineri]|uniref:Uncharacterized protein n=1 Tax=Adineta steineri TaxID=433720 RepID=A0A814W5F3_9BILA|nr:unnamed protein product [Adineta steineri]
MDNDTVFPALSGGEIIVGKYRGTDHSRMTKAVVILTNFRLLIRWQRTICGCFTRSSYSSIRLNSIDRIDDMRSDPSSFGSETIIFQKAIANEFEERLSEMIHQRSIQCFTGKNEHNGSRLLSEPSAPMVSRNIIDIEMETDKIYAYQPLPSVA